MFTVQRMLRFIGFTLLILLLAAGAAAALLLYRSPDPVYTVQETLNFSRFKKYDRLILDVAQKHDVDPMLVKAVIWRESSFHSGKHGKNGERGLMQVTEGAASDWAKATKVENFVPTDLFNARTNVEVGTWYLKQALQRWDSRDDPLPFALAEYNAGKSRVDRWIAETNMGDRATADDFRTSISFPSTRTYVETIMDRFRFYKKRGRM